MILQSRNPLLSFVVSNPYYYSSNDLIASLFPTEVTELGV